MSNYFYIDGYWKDDSTKIYSALVTDREDYIDNDGTGLFFYGINEEMLKEAIELGKDTAYEFVITKYEAATYYTV